MLEGKLDAVAPQSFTLDGTTDGLVTIGDTAGFRVKQVAYLKNNTSSLAVQVKRVLSVTQLIVGYVDQKIATWPKLDISVYTVASGAQIGAESQDKSNIPRDDHYRTVYESDPVLADRMVFVDKYGRYYDYNNPFPIIFDGTVTVGNVKVVNFPDLVDVNYGNVGSSTIRTAAQIGNATGSAAFGSGLTTAQVLRVVLPTDQTPIPISNFPTVIDTNYGIVSTNTLRTAAQIGNATGASDFNAGITGLQTLRTTANITRNGNELSYNDGTSDANTLRTSANLKRQGNDLDYNFGVASSNTLRTSSLIGNATGPADFNIGATGAQTLRVASNLYDSSANGLTSTLLSGKRALDVNIANDTFQVDVGTPDESSFTYGSSIQQPVGGVFQDVSPGLTAGQTGVIRLTQNRAFHTNLRNTSGTELDYNFGVSSAATLRTSALIGNATGVADFNYGAIGAQTLRTASQLGNSAGAIDYNFGIVGAQTIRVAAEIGNSTGSADFNAGVTGIQTLRISSNITRNGTELSYNAGASDANTLRSAVNLKREGNDLDYNFGVASTNSLRIAALVGNATGAADFNAGITGLQTLRTTSNITRNGTELSYNSGASDANTLRTSSNLKREGNDLDYNYGIVGANTLRTASQIGNATGTADFNVGASGAQTLRVAANLADGNANKITSQANGAQRALDVGINVAGVQVDPRTIGVVQTTAPVVKTTGTVTQATSDEYARIANVPVEAINTEWGQMFSVVLNSAALSGTTETPLLYINNPNGSGKSLKMWELEFSPTLGNNYVTYRVYKDATITANGSALTINGSRQTGQNTTVASAFSGPTASSNGTLIHHSVASGLSGNDVLWHIGFTEWLEPNHNWLITRQLSANATAGGIDIKWAEQ